MKTFKMSESLYDAIFSTVEDYMHVLEHIELEYGLKDTGVCIRNYDATSPGFWTDEDQYVFDVVDEKKFVMFILRWA